MEKQIIVNSQWQGGNDLVTYYGGEELKQLYLSEVELTEAPVCKNAVSQAEHHIIGYSDIKAHMESVFKLLNKRKASPKKSAAVSQGAIQLST